MEVFGPTWENYENRIEENWRQVVTESDTVLIPGDISWGMQLEDAAEDLRRLDDLPGQKLLLKGNHDYWWGSLSKLKRLELKTIRFLQNNAYMVEGVHLIGTRGWSSRDSQEFNDGDEVVFKRELIRLQLSADARKGTAPTIAMLHYPPFDKTGRPNEFGELLEQIGVDLCIYGHLHSEGLYAAVEGVINTVEYRCISADYLSFRPVLLWR